MIKIKYEEDGIKLNIDFLDAKTKHIEYFVENASPNQIKTALRELRNDLREKNTKCLTLEAEVEKLRVELEEYDR
jgi:hypothetical protein